MATTIGSLDLNAFNGLYSDSTQYFWFESNASATYGAGAHVTLVPDTSFISNPTGQNILMNTDGFSIRNGLLPMMTLDNDSLDFNVVDTTAGTYTTTATFMATGAQIGQDSGAHSVIDVNGQRFYASNGTTQLANIGYGLGEAQSGTAIAPYYTFGVRKTTTTAYSSSSTYAVGDMCVYDEKVYVCIYDITTPESWTASHWRYYIGNYSHAAGYDTIAGGYTSHAEGSNTIASGNYSHAEGGYTTANGAGSHAEGSNTTASNSFSHAEGYDTTASGVDSHAEGAYTTASNGSSHAEGYYTTASGFGSHAEGDHTTASDNGSHAEGYNTTASGIYSHAQNRGTIASKSNQTVIGKYNIEDTAIATADQKAFIIGNGTSTTPSNALTVDWNGNVIGQAMAGIIQMFAGATSPTGWLICDGSAVSRTTYATLFAVIGTTWGVGDGSTTFNLPDLRGRAPIGAGTGTGLTARTLGTQNIGSEDAIIPYHNHSVSAVSNAITGGSHNHDVRRTGSNAAAGSARYTASGSIESGFTTSTETHTHNLPAHNTNYVGTDGNTVGANMQPSAVVNFIICTGKTS